MATHSSVLAWRIPWAEETGGLTAYEVAKSWTRLKQLITKFSRLKTDVDSRTLTLTYHCKVEKGQL